MSIEALKQAIAFTQEGRISDAEKIYLELVEQTPNDSIYLSAFGLFYIGLRKFDKAYNYIKKAYDISATFGTISALGMVEYELQHYHQAVSLLEQALTLGENVDIYNKLVLSLLELKKYTIASKYIDKMYELYPDNIKSVVNKIKILTKFGKMIEAEILCVESLKKNPAQAALWTHLGFLKELIHSDERQSIECFKLSAEYGGVGMNYNIAVAYQKLGKYDKAEEYYKKFQAENIDDETVNVSLGMCYLRQKKFKEGYDLFYKRVCKNVEIKTTNLWKPGTPLDKKIVILCDQGLGDQIQFIRYIPFLKEHNIKVAASAKLIDLFRKNYPATEFIELHNVNPETQSVRLCDLPYVLNMDFDNIPFAEGYLDIEPADIKNEKLKVGLCWEAGSAAIRNMINRTINIWCFEPLLNMKNIQIYSFQYKDSQKGNERYADKMINLAKDFMDFSDTARALKAMDVVITVDTSVAHLAGAMGVKTYLLLPYSPDWRWFDSDKITPWYSSIQIFKQIDRMSWEKQINQIVALLENFKK